jgi:hypothetical protein
MATGPLWAVQAYLFITASSCRFTEKPSKELNHVLNSIMTFFILFYSVLFLCNQINTTGGTSGAGNAYTSEAPEFTPVTRSVVVCVICRSLFFFSSFCCLFFDLRILITSLVSSNSSWSSLREYLCLTLSFDRI